MNDPRFHELISILPTWAKELGFQQLGFSKADPSAYVPRLQEWLAQGYHGDMQWMSDRLHLRSHPDELLPGALTVISVRMDYLVDNTQPEETLDNPEKAYISRYALGRDYHKLMRQRLAILADKIRHWCDEEIGIRPFVDSAPLLEKPFAEQAGIGWIGKNTLILNQEAGSWFFLGELLTTLPLMDTIHPTEAADHCGKCRACLKICPTDAFPKPYVLDANRCISYLTIEHNGAIPVELRSKMGNRVFGCDDCQLICPWNRYAQFSQETDFQPRHKLENADLVDLFEWGEEEFLVKTAGSPIRRIGFERWQRNLAIGLGNGPANNKAILALTQKKNTNHSSLVKEHIEWALHSLQMKSE